MTIKLKMLSATEAQMETAMDVISGMQYLPDVSWDSGPSAGIYDVEFRFHVDIIGYDAQQEFCRNIKALQHRNVIFGFGFTAVNSHGETLDITSAIVN